MEPAVQTAPHVELADAGIERILDLARTSLGMDVAFVGEFRDGQRRFRAVAHADGPHPEEGSGDPLDQSYCALIADGTLGPLIPDTQADPTLARMPVTEQLGIRSYAGVPITLSTGDLYGTLCCYGSTPNHTLTERDTGILQLLAKLCAERLEHESLSELKHLATLVLVEDVLAGEDPAIVFQPLVDLRSGHIVGYEALSRFNAPPMKGPEEWFAAAAEVGFGSRMEAKAVRAALDKLPQIPEGQYLSVNFSASALCSDVVAEELACVPLHRLVLELTEHERYPDHERLTATIAAYRRRGARLAMDDVGAGYAGLERVLRLAPDIVKLDRSVVTNVGVDPARQALVTAAVGFARSVGTCVLAEGIETATDCTMLRRLGVEFGQGYFLARPADAPWERMAPDVRLLPPTKDPARSTLGRDLLLVLAVTTAVWMASAATDLSERLLRLAGSLEAYELDELPVALAGAAVATIVVLIVRARDWKREVASRYATQRRLSEANAELWRMRLSGG